MNVVVAKQGELLSSTAASGSTSRMSLDRRLIPPDEWPYVCLSVRQSVRHPIFSRGKYRSETSSLPLLFPTYPVPSQGRSRIVAASRFPLACLFTQNEGETIPHVQQQQQQQQVSWLSCITTIQPGPRCPCLSPTKYRVL